ncbi:hypothetical protein [Rhodoferax sp.]|uniref:hypothetical protein n=1 Tax=Rhodoferax sp. TaxID=50421 RepID=UPI0025EB99FB|nr:hypothetical protein [Rhodoferax sp.]
MAILWFPALSLWASDTPLSGTFSNVKNTEMSGYTASMKNKINLVVTIGQGGQQFFIQCFEGEKAGLGVVTLLKTPQREAKVKAGPECPARNVVIQLDYEEAFVRIGSGFVYLPRGSIHVPIAP